MWVLGHDVKFIFDGESQSRKFEGHFFERI